MNLRPVVLLVLLAFCTIGAKAQAVPDTSLNQPVPDSARARQQEVANLPNDAAGLRYNQAPGYPNPKKAGLYSAILPGMGQLYNRQYWKLPLVYGGAAASVYFIKFNSDQYQSYRRAYIAALEGRLHEYSGIYELGALKQLQDGYKRYLDMTVLFTAIGYTLQVIDAIVFSHLKNFDISRDISLRMQPVQAPAGPGLGLVMHFK
ncbi:MAG: hypothetical protein EOP49_15815 [Sphingobacteriales bacterium]|nr:MAG: hypothetical protein EOP49_15815 [Sphingobacteriales bacterium]